MTRCYKIMVIWSYSKLLNRSRGRVNGRVFQWLRFFKNFIEFNPLGQNDESYGWSISVITAQRLVRSYGHVILLLTLKIKVGRSIFLEILRGYTLNWKNFMLYIASPLLHFFYRSRVHTCVSRTIMRFTTRAFQLYEANDCRIDDENIIRGLSRSIDRSMRDRGCENARSVSHYIKRILTTYTRT